ncbi:hypothetical protein V6N13_028606 [Hibiscus sabdariffa]|uniref:Uncharacterized protein n=1 Tax=Hibiscus sabdariffa TaxID=183260 RepID=A0ABR2P9F6_9ROSI
MVGNLDDGDECMELAGGVDEASIIVVRPRWISNALWEDNGECSSVECVHVLDAVVGCVDRSMEVEAVECPLTDVAQIEEVLDDIPRIEFNVIPEAVKGKR